MDRYHQYFYPIFTVNNLDEIGSNKILMYAANPGLGAVERKRHCAHYIRMALQTLSEAPYYSTYNSRSTDEYDSYHKELARFNVLFYNELVYMFVNKWKIKGYMVCTVVCHNNEEEIYMRPISYVLHESFLNLLIKMMHSLAQLKHIFDHSNHMISRLMTMDSRFRR